MYAIASSKRFLKAAKRHARSGGKHVVLAAEEVIHLLSVHDDRSLFMLGHRWRDHALKGDKSGIRELHVGFDELLLYRIHHATRTVELLDIINHEELRKW